MFCGLWLGRRHEDVAEEVAWAASATGVLQQSYITGLSGPISPVHNAKGRFAKLQGLARGKGIDALNIRDGLETKRLCRILNAKRTGRKACKCHSLTSHLRSTNGDQFSEILVGQASVLDESARSILKPFWPVLKPCFQFL